MFVFGFMQFFLVSLFYCGVVKLLFVSCFSLRFYAKFKLMFINVHIN